MIILGLTGGIGSGKTYVANIFENKGVPVYNSDIRAKILMNTNDIIKQELVQKFGQDVFIDNVLNRSMISDRIFSDKSLIDWINDLVHPIVKLDFEEWLLQQKASIVIKEAAILIESGAYKQCDEIVLVTAPNEVRIERIKRRDNMTLEQIKKRMSNQMTDSERVKYADYIIVNDGIKIVNTQIDKIIKKIEK
jgi:dephospho-CoA kinase